MREGGLNQKEWTQGNEWGKKRRRRKKDRPLKGGREDNTN